jgi:hypothetical protein
VLLQCSAMLAGVACLSDNQESCQTAWPCPLRICNTVKAVSATVNHTVDKRWRMQAIRTP